MGLAEKINICSTGMANLPFCLYTLVLLQAAFHIILYFPIIACLVRSQALLVPVQEVVRTFVAKGLQRTLLPRTFAFARDRDRFHC